jgi:1A family penicillin-binding protein
MTRERKTPRREPGQGPPPPDKAPNPAPKSAAKGKPARKRSGGPLDRAIRGVLLFALRWGWRVGSRVALGLALALGVATWHYFGQLPEADELLDGRSRGSVTMLDRRGQVFAWRGDQYGGALRASETSPHLVNAVIATEDRRFFSHYGVDPIGLARAMAANIMAGRLVQGGSTLTQQTAKNVFLTNERSIERKLKEMPMALAMELKYSKEEILSIYLNRVYLGAGAYGFEAAAQRYFGKSARAVFAAEAAMLAGLLKAPTRYAPTSDLAAAQGRAGVIIGLMEAQGVLSQSLADEARARPAQLSAAASARAGGAYADWVMEALPAWLTSESAEDVVIETTFDARLQADAEAALADVFATKVRKGSKAQAAIVVMDHDGAVRAVIGGRGGEAGGFNRATQARRQPGSAFKPVVYAAALEAGAHPLDRVVDRPITVKGWSPQNYGGGYAGTMTLTDAVAGSVNTVAVRTAQDVGMRRVQDMAQRLGMISAIAPGLASALGTSEATLLEMTGVYATIANGGALANPWAVRRAWLRGDGPGKALFAQPPGGGAQAISGRHAAMLTSMLEEVVRRGTGARAALGDRPAAGKTGTTQAARDAWFIGYTADYVTGVWMGYDDNTPLTGVTGGGLPADIWRETMLRLHRGLAPRPLTGAGGDHVARAEAVDDDVARSVLSDVIGFLSRGLGGGGTPSPSQEGWER